MTENIQVTFVIPKHCKSQNDCSEEMLIAYSACDNHQGGGLKAQWVHESKLNLDPKLQKKHIFVLSDFEGEVFEQLKSTNCMLIGPRCLSCCLTEGNSIPSKGHPVFTVAMRGLVVTTTGLPKDIKAKIQLKIEWMGGSYSSVLTDATTHLISNNVFSDKYIKATERGIPVMRETWVDAVWEASLKLDVNGSSTDFDCYRLPPFANLQITTSGLSQHDKKLIMKLINSNGGEFSRVFQSQTTDVLVLPKNNLESEKCKAAIEYGKVCVTPHWIKDSAALGFALPVSRYQICTASTSSPIAENRLPDMSLNFSRISRVGDHPPLNNIQVLSESTKIQNDQNKDTSVIDDIQQAFESFDLAHIKKAGPIFDGLCVWVTGLEGVARERAAACVSRGGGVRYDGPHERVTHAVAGAAAAAAAAAALPAVPVLSPLWLLRSLEAGRLLDEHEFVLNTVPATPQKARRPPTEAASPMSRRNLQLLRAGRAGRASAPPPPPSADDSSDQIINHYLSQTLPHSEGSTFVEPFLDNKPEVANEFVNQSEYSETVIFKDMVIEVQGLEEAAICEIEVEIRAAGGVLAAAGAGGAHVLVPLNFDVAQLRTPAAEPVTVFWVKDCLSQEALVPIEYYHRPVRVRTTGEAPLRGVVASLSTYTGVERAFLSELAKLLGATTQQRFCRRDTASALASTHLICPEASGAKYAGAAKWGVPAVRADWLLACAAAGARVPEAAHSVDAPPGPLTVSAPDDVKQLAKDMKDTISSSLATPNSIKNKSEDKENLNDNSKVMFEEKSKENAEELENEPGMVTVRKPEEILLQNKTERMFQEMLEEMRREMPAAVSELHRSDKNKKQSENSNLEEGEVELESTIKTPSAADVLLTPNLRRLSPSTRSRLQAVKRGETLFDPIRTPINPFEKKTPNSIIGEQLRPSRKRMSVDARKQLWEFVNNLPAGNDLLGDDDDSPLTYAYIPTLSQLDSNESCSEEKNARNLDLEDFDGNAPPKMAKLTENQCAGGAGAAVATLPPELEEQLQLLSSTLDSLRAQRAAPSRSYTVRADENYDYAPESKPNTVGWDDTIPSRKDLNISRKVFQLKRVKSAPSEMIPTQKDSKVTDSKQNITDPIHHHNDKNNVEEIAKAVETAKINLGEDPENDRARNTTEVGGYNSPLTQNIECQDITLNQCPEKNDKTFNSLITLKLCRTKRFIVSSNVDNDEETMEMIVRLGGAVTDLDEDPPATHLLCAVPARSQRILSCIATGCWVLHPAYVAHSAAAGAFLPEQWFEWGNPSARCLPELEGVEAALARAAHRWRVRRARGWPGPFAGIAALLHVPAARHCLLARFICAGGGTVVDQQPPYTNESITVCFADPKRYSMTRRDREWLRARRVPVCAPVLLSALLTDEPRPDLRAHCLPDFRPNP